MEDFEPKQSGEYTIQSEYADSFRSLVNQAGFEYAEFDEGDFVRFQIKDMVSERERFDFLLEKWKALRKWNFGNPSDEEKRMSKVKSHKVHQHFKYSDFDKAA